MTVLEILTEISDLNKAMQELRTVAPMTYVDIKTRLKNKHIYLYRKLRKVCQCKKTQIVNK